MRLELIAKFGENAGQITMNAHEALKGWRVRDRTCLWISAQRENLLRYLTRSGAHDLEIHDLVEGEWDRDAGPLSFE
jgi:hypothetical protein